MRCVADAMPCDGAECTFIVLDPSQPDTPGTGELGGAMVGDVNLFLLEPGEAEVEVMIAESSARGKGIGRQAYVSLKSMCVESDSDRAATAVGVVGLQQQQPQRTAHDVIRRHALGNPQVRGQDRRLERTVVGALPFVGIRGTLLARVPLPLCARHTHALTHATRRRAALKCSKR